MGMVREFREFATRGNALDLAVGVIIGGAFGRITTSLVNDVLLPPVGLLLGGIDFSYLAIVLQPETETSEPVLLGYGAFINTVLEFLIVALAVFALVKAVNTLRRQEAQTPSGPPAPSRQEVLLMEIRDALRNR